MLAGTALVLEAVPYAANGDRRYDRVTWKSSRPGVADVTPLGHLTARAAGRATITATAGKASESWTVVVLPNPVVRLSLAPADTAGEWKSTRLNSSHVRISYAVFFFKKKNDDDHDHLPPGNDRRIYE